MTSLPKNKLRERYLFLGATLAPESREHLLKLQHWMEAHLQRENFASEWVKEPQDALCLVIRNLGPFTDTFLKDICLWHDEQLKSVPKFVITPVKVMALPPMAPRQLALDYKDPTRDGRGVSLVDRVLQISDEGLRRLGAPALQQLMPPHVPLLRAPAPLSCNLKDLIDCVAAGWRAFHQEHGRIPVKVNELTIFERLPEARGGVHTAEIQRLPLQ